ncbi:MFS transporter [Actinoplanes sp. NEAU-A12]|uniref:MFS transporter n=1 Tax=Actinoplanes sandaracinus TaxID=3045177 RepID=A0ABT6WEQ8_9ACTN|nr:MFS transporter [Actinoplanes sandaracinus]MDI6098217.1 MFS transporter [Actinoplanes sandaracinus]
MHALQEGVLLYPVYALLFADTGLTTGEISSLFIIWSVVSFACEVPAGALADAWSRKRLYALGEIITAAGFGLWLLWPTYPGFALGFLLWGLGGAFASGSLEALVYDHLGDGAAYSRVIGHARTAGLLAMLAATLLATPAYLTGGYLLVGVISIATVTAGGLLALRLPEKPFSGTDVAGDDRTPGSPVGSAPDSPPAPEPGYAELLRAGVRAVTGSSRALRALLVAAAVPGFSALDEYLPLLGREMGAPTQVVPLLFAATALAMAAGSSLAGRLPPTTPRPLAGALTLAAVLLAAGSLVPHPAGMLAVSAAFGLLQFAMVHAESRLQDTITGPARATALSVAGFGAEVFAVTLYAAFVLPVPLPVLCAGMAVPLLITARLAVQR